MSSVLDRFSLKLLDGVGELLVKLNRPTTLSSGSSF